MVIPGSHLARSPQGLRDCGEGASVRLGVFFHMRDCGHEETDDFVLALRKSTCFHCLFADVFDDGVVW